MLSCYKFRGFFGVKNCLLSPLPSFYLNLGLHLSSSFVISRIQWFGAFPCVWSFVPNGPIHCPTTSTWLSAGILHGSVVLESKSPCSFLLPTKALRSETALPAVLSGPFPVLLVWLEESPGVRLVHLEILSVPAQLLTERLAVSCGLQILSVALQCLARTWHPCLQRVRPVWRTPALSAHWQGAKDRSFNRGQKRKWLGLSCCLCALSPQFFPEQGSAPSLPISFSESCLCHFIIPEIICSLCRCWLSVCCYVLGTLLGAGVTLVSPVEGGNTDQQREQEWKH